VTRYVVDVGTPAPIEDARCTDLATLGFHRAGEYRAGRDLGEVWIDENGTTMVSIHRRFGQIVASAQSVLEDGTNVCTDEKGSLLGWLLLPAARKLPAEHLSVAFPLDVYDVKQLVATHRTHVEKMEVARKSKVKAGASIATFVAARNDIEKQVSAVRSLLRRVGFSLGGLGLFGGALIAALQAMNDRGEQIGQWLEFGLMMGAVMYVMGSRFFGPSLVQKGTLAASAPRATESAGASSQGSAEEITSIRAKNAWLLAALWTLGVGAVAGASLKGAGGLPLVVEALTLTGIGELALSAILDRKGKRGRRVTWKIADGMLHVDGERPLALGEISAVFRSDGQDPALVVLDRRGRVALRLTGPDAMLDEIRDAVSPKRSSLPITRDFRTLAAFLVPLLGAVVLAFGKPGWASAFYGIAGCTVALAPLSRLRRRRTVEVGVDGIVLDGRYLAFAGVASITTIGDRVTVLEKNGERTSLELEQPGSTIEIARRWSEHTARSEDRDEAQLVRRRVAIEDESEDVPYRARIASPEELGEALLDSAEEQGVRVRAAKRLARSEGEDAARVREDAREQVVDPHVRHALDRPRE
jgi:hypothetical protein